MFFAPFFIHDMAYNLHKFLKQSSLKFHRHFSNFTVL